MVLLAKLHLYYTWRYVCLLQIVSLLYIQFLIALRTCCSHRDQSWLSVETVEMKILKPKHSLCPKGSSGYVLKWPPMVSSWTGCQMKERRKENVPDDSQGSVLAGISLRLSPLQASDIQTFFLRDIRTRKNISTASHQGEEPKGEGDRNIN